MGSALGRDVCGSRSQERRPYLSASTSSLQNGKLASAELVWVLSIFNSISSYEETQGKWSARTGPTAQIPAPSTKSQSLCLNTPMLDAEIVLGTWGRGPFT